jgi:hypothetical protein
MKHGSSLERSVVAAAAGWGLVAACVEIPTSAGSIASPSAEVIAADGADAGGGSTLTYPDDELGPRVVITGPTEGSQATGPTVQVTGTVTDDRGIAALTVQVGGNVEIPVDPPDSEGAFLLEVTLGFGAQPIIVRAYDLGMAVGEAKVSVLRVPGVADLEAPTLEIQTPLDGFAVTVPEIWVGGSTADDVGIVSVTVSVNGGAAEPAETDDHFGTWFHRASLAPGANLIAATATDTAGQTASVTLTGSAGFASDLDPPSLAFTSPAEGFQTQADQIEVKGTASDAAGIALVEVRNNAGPYQAAASTDGFATWSATIALLPGENLVKARATDKNGLVTTLTLSVQNTSGDTWGFPTTLTLTWAAPEYGTSTFTLNRDQLAELLPPDSAEQLVLVELDLKPIISSTLTLIRDACGSGWQDQDVSSQCPKAWGQQEKNLFRLLTMTPTNINLEGTSFEEMKGLGEFLHDVGLIDAFQVVLAKALGIGVYDPIVPPSAIAEAMLEGVLKAHPNVGPAGKLAVTMLDALTDMKTLAERFDAAGSHPGFLESVQGGTYAKVLTDGFLMHLEAVSNLHWHDGVRLGALSKGYLAIVSDQTGPAYGDVLEFDFLDPSAFWITGIADAPTCDMSFKAIEKDGWVYAGTSMSPTPKGDGPGWSIDSWLLERVVLDAAYIFYKDHRAGCDLCSCESGQAILYEVPSGCHWYSKDATEITVGRQGYAKDGQDPENLPWLASVPAGWMRIWAFLDAGNPPPHQYVWDMVMEVGERRIQDGGVAEGDGDVLFHLVGVDVGVSGEEIIQAVRPSLEAQKSKMSDLLLGDYNETAKALDFYLAKGADGGIWLYFVSPSDPVPTGTAGHAKPGFYSELGLVAKVSSKQDGGSGDTVHEKIVMGATPQTVYCQDLAGTAYQVKVGVLAGDQVDVTIRKHVSK